MRNLHVSAIKYSLPNLHKSSIPPKLHWIWQWCMSFAHFFIRNTVKQGWYLTHMVSPDKIQHVGSKSEYLLSEYWREENISVTVSKLGKTDLVFMQPGAKINSVYYCENVLQQGLLPAIRCNSNNDFVFMQDGATCTPFTTLSLSLTCIPMRLSSLNQKTGRRTVQI